MDYGSLPYQTLNQRKAATDIKVRPSLKFDPYVTNTVDTLVKEDETRVIAVENNDKSDKMPSNQEEVDTEDLHAKTERYD